MIQIGNYVYHRGINASGIVDDIDDDKRRDTHHVTFLWGKHSQGMIKHGTYTRINNCDLNMWCDPSNLQDIGQHPMDSRIPARNKVTSFGGRSLDKLVRKMVGMNRRRSRDGSNIIINYGTKSSMSWNPQNILILNRNLVCDKYQQMKVMGEDLCLESVHTRSGEPNASDWIIKPNYSIGGKNIRNDDGNGLNYGEYYQRKFPKVREFRVHVMLWAKNKTPLIQEKVIHNKDQLCWNKKQGGTFTYPYVHNFHQDPMQVSKTNLKILSDMCILACRKLEYDFGGVDVGMDSQGNFKIFEVNSRMGLKEKSFPVYMQTFWELFYLNINQYKQERGW